MADYSVAALNLARYTVKRGTECTVRDGVEMMVREGFSVDGSLVLEGALIVEPLRDYRS